ncbi:TonB family protein [Pseudodonghicola flavimaris]|uniref:TonB family protein n=1 Tax=Pseudodonghicola flavimaris TaxID=3050036 RepID=A0ABT7F131_9RHOB|nr:TonB family protein [Pseudodonghicola flavimaris]MDK3018303.1 TonB family protein [Pseudodonghicola flavimaris]
MKPGVEVVLFGGLAVGLHLLVLAAVLPESGADSGGSGGSEGDSLVSLEAARTQLATQVARWGQAPETAPAPVAPTTPLSEPRLPASEPAQTSDTPTPLPVQPAPALPLPQPDSLPDPVALPLAAPQLASALTELPALPRASETAPETPTSAPAPARPTSPEPPKALARPAAEPAPTAMTAPPPLPPLAKPAPRPAPKPAGSQPAPDRPVAQRAQPASEGAVAQRAAGTGATPMAGTGAQTGGATLNPGARKSLMTDWGSQIRARIERRKRFPPTLRRGGRVVVNVRVSRDGELLGVALRQSSGQAALDEAALAAVTRIRRFPPAPEALTGKSFLFSIPIAFRR